MDQKCQHFNIKKQRPCNMEVYKVGMKYCVFHGKEYLDMVDCPLDGTHQVQREHLEKHLKKCNKLKLQIITQNNPFYQEKINNPEKEEVQRLKLQQLTPEQFRELIDQVPKSFDKALQIYSEYLKLMNKEQQNLRDYLLDPFDGGPLEISDNEKDLRQVKLLSQIMHDHKLLHPDYSYIEYGAGKGRLSHQIAEDIKEKFENQKAVHVLIEREPRKCKFDRFHRDNPFFIRCRMDITDFNLQILKEQLKGYTKEIEYVGVCKHMCGGATDLTLTSLLSQLPRGLAIATCCHHLCDLKTYKNIGFLKEIGIEGDLIEQMFQCSSWYVSGAIRKQVKIENQLINSNERRLLGIMAKRISDIGRVLWIYEQTKKPAILVKYCEQNLSPENFIILQYN